MGQNGFGTAQQHHEVRQGGKTDHGQHYAKGQRRKKAGGSKAGGGVGILTAQAAADDGAGAVPQHKAQRLNNGHQAGNDAHRAGSAGGDAPHKKGIGQIVDAGDQHTQNRGRGKAEDQPGDRGLGHFVILHRSAVLLGHGQISSFKNEKAAPSRAADHPDRNSITQLRQNVEREKKRPFSPAKGRKSR